MDNVIQMSERPQSAAARAPRSQSGPAEIVIFPGVRFERLDQAEQSSRPRRMVHIQTEATAKDLL